MTENHRDTNHEYNDRLIKKLQQRVIDLEKENIDVTDDAAQAMIVINNMGMSMKTKDARFRNLLFLLSMITAFTVIIIINHVKQEKALFEIQDKYQQLKNQHDYDNRKK